MHALSHSAQTDSERSFVANPIEKLRVDATPMVLNFKHRGVVTQEEANFCRAAAGMPVNVSQGLLKNAEHCQFEVARQPRKGGVLFEGDIDLTPRRKAVEVPLRSGSESAFFQQRRMQEIRKRSHLFD